MSRLFFEKTPTPIVNTFLAAPSRSTIADPLFNFGHNTYKELLFAYPKLSIKLTELEYTNTSVFLQKLAATSTFILATGHFEDRTNYLEAKDFLTQLIHKEPLFWKELTSKLLVITSNITPLTPQQQELANDIRKTFNFTDLIVVNTKIEKISDKLSAFLLSSRAEQTLLQEASSIWDDPDNKTDVKRIKKTLRHYNIHYKNAVRPHDAPATVLSFWDTYHSRATNEFTLRGRLLKLDESNYKKELVNLYEHARDLLESDLLCSLIGFIANKIGILLPEVEETAKPSHRL